VRAQRVALICLCVACLGLPWSWESPLTPTLSPLRKGGEGEGSGGILPQGEPLTLRARHIRAVRQPDGTLLLEARGAVELLYGTRRLRTEALQLDTATALVQGEAPFELITPQGWLRGQSLTYFYEQQRGRFHAIEAVLYPPRPRHATDLFTPIGEKGLAIRLQAQVMEGDLQRFEAQRVWATTCERESPDFVVEAARVRLIGGARLRLFNARLRWKGRTLLNIPALTLRLRERRETLELPSPTYHPDTGFGARYQLELPLGERTLFALHGAFYLRALPETRLALAAALTGDAPTITEPELNQRLESNALYNLRVSPESERAALRDWATTLHVEHAAEVRPLFARDARLRVSRPLQVAINTGFALGEGAGGLTLRLGAMRERLDNQRTPTLQRWVVETEWLQPLMQREPLEISLHLWASHLRYSNGNQLSWLRPQIELRYQPSEQFSLMLGYAVARVWGSTPFRVDRVPVRQELALRGEGLWGNLRWGVLLKYDLEQSELFDVQLFAGWRQHCIEPFVYWRRTPGALLLGIRLASDR
jgi:hypothetical protein